jgi:hypothetical protein
MILSTLKEAGVELEAPVRELLKSYKAMGGASLDLNDPAVLAMVRATAIQTDQDLSRSAM